ncbi:hypothetical protein G9A89_011844 [Geosiphon pyriformis]|nr:hypothetical protein G9A89_011844 [Geosiphon pyriformis]
MNLLHKYDAAIIKNASQISSIESSLRMLTYILPGRFEDSEFASGALFAALNLIGLYHDSILVRAAANLPPSKKPIPSPHNRYTRYWVNSSKTYQRAAFLLTLLQYTEVLLEMGVQKKWGKEVKWRLIVTIESIKSICRIVLLYKTKKRIVVQPSIPRREIDPAIFSEELSIKETRMANGYWPDSVDNAKQINSSWTGARTGLKRPHISTISQSYNLGSKDVTEYLMSRVLMVEDVRNPKDLIHVLGSFGTIGELLFIFKPLLYVLAIKKFGTKSWVPWLSSLGIEISARLLINLFYKARIPGGYRWLSSLEKEEHKRRFYQFFFYLLRGPFYDKFTKPKINAFCNSVSTKPILSLLGGILRDYQPLLENFYFYMLVYQYGDSNIFQGEINFDGKPFVQVNLSVLYMKEKTLWKAVPNLGLDYPPKSISKITVILVSTTLLLKATKSYVALGILNIMINRLWKQRFR